MKKIQKEKLNEVLFLDKSRTRPLVIKDNPTTSIKEWILFTLDSQPLGQKALTRDNLKSIQKIEDFLLNDKDCLDDKDFNYLKNLIEVDLQITNRTAFEILTNFIDSFEDC